MQLLTLRERFDEIEVMCPQDLPTDFRDLIFRGLLEGRILCVTRHVKADTVKCEWAFLQEKEDTPF